MSGDVTDDRYAEMFVPGGQVEYEERATPALADFEESDREVSGELLDPEGSGYVAEPPWDAVETALERAYRLGEGCGGLDAAGVRRLVELSGGAA